MKVSERATVPHERKTTETTTAKPDQKSPAMPRAAQYVRMSTDPQEYSIDLQVAVIAVYAARRGIEIVRTYSDPGRSGLTIARRIGLQQLIDDVESGKPDFDCVLVSDVSRWGRFQDADESAYYEFICKRAGISVHYCSEEFENDGSLSSVILKNLKRAGAAGFSKDLSRNVFLGQSNIVKRGYWRGGAAPYGLRRMLVDANGKRKGLLQRGQHKNLKSERIILVQGPSSEVRIVRRIFSSFVMQKKNRTQIANELNAEGTLSPGGKQWTALTLSNLLANEIYLGHIIFNRHSMKLAGRRTDNPPEMWIRHDNAFKGIINPRLFARARQRLAQVANNKKETDQQLLDALAALLRRKGRLSVHIIQAAKGVRHPTVYTNRFGSLMRAYELVGFRPQARYRFLEVAVEIDRTICSVVDDIIIDLRGHGVNASFLHELYLLTISGGLTVSVAVARAVSDGGTKSRRWEIRRLKYQKAELTLLIRMDSGNSRISDYFLLPTVALPLTKDRKKLRVSDRLFARMRLDSLEAVMGALYGRLRVSREERRMTRVLPLPDQRRSLAKLGQPMPTRSKRRVVKCDHRPAPIEKRR
ncbi:recombinase family protein [Bradyrhizobium genosp. L]|uniref:recombinase family protein n=1 Tax=Bradyrhizobium genosp. L TaxID=83637 RepID=UPI0018A314BC|nr:recombinase family protein [Bradyrhizobium genosp. L]QPF83919.1 recombinase family protein [Bradyrhizobium genosp. L]